MRLKERLEQVDAICGDALRVLSQPDTIARAKVLHGLWVDFSALVVGEEGRDHRWLFQGGDCKPVFDASSSECWRAIQGRVSTLLDTLTAKAVQRGEAVASSLEAWRNNYEASQPHLDPTFDSGSFTAAKRLAEHAANAPTVRFGELITAESHA